MSLDILQIEKSLLEGTWRPLADESDPIVNLAKHVINGNFRDALTSPTTRSLLQVRSNLSDQPINTLLSLEIPPTDNQAEEELRRLLLAVACLHAFIQVNWTGPNLDVQPWEVISLDSAESNTINGKSISELAYGGEPAYHLTEAALLLRLAQILLGLSYDYCQTVPWWRLRTAYVHQQVLDEPVALPASIPTAVEALLPHFATEPDLEGRLLLELGLLQHHFSQDKLAAEYFIRAARATGLQYELTGALGKRTKFQEKELSQLVLLAESRLDLDGTDVSNTNNGPSTTPADPAEHLNLPETLSLNDDTLLEQTEFTSSQPSVANRSPLKHIDPSNQPPLHPIDQCILLSLCLNVQNTSPSHGLTTEQMFPYVSRVIQHPRNWSLHTMALLLRSRLESSRTRTVERSTLQLQALIDQMPTADSTLSERLAYFHSIPLPSKWEMERELALRFLSLGVVRSALAIFERLEMWEEVVKCWGSMERSDKAIVIVRDLLEGRRYEAEAVLSKGKATTAGRRQTLDAAREAKLWCLLGDLEPENAVEHYERAWTISEETSGRAMRSLGGYYFARAEFAQAIICLKRAVAINPLLSRSWFILGCACMRLEQWNEAKIAFSRCVAIDEEDGESWNNLASMYLRMGKGGKKVDKAVDSDTQIESKMSDNSLAYTEDVPESIPFSNKLLAFRALKEGLRSSYENWRMWNNYMIVAMDVGELFEASRALGRVVEETSDKVGAKSVDEDVLERLVDAVTRAPANSEDSVEGGDIKNAVRNPNEGHGLLRSVSNLFVLTLLPRVSSPRIFRAYARLLSWQSKWEDAVKAYLDGYRCSVAGTMEKGETDGAKWREAVLEVEEIVDVLRNFGPKAGSFNWKLQARSIVRTFIGRTKDFEDEPEWDRLTRLQEDLRKEENA